MLETRDAAGNTRAVGAVVGTPDSIAVEAAHKLFNQGKSLEQTAKEIGKDVQKNPEILDNDTVLPVPEPPRNTPPAAKHTLTRKRNKALSQIKDPAPVAQQGEKSDAGEIQAFLQDRYLSAVLRLNKIDPVGLGIEAKDDIFSLLPPPLVSFVQWCRIKGYVE